ncbi:helix-turn-helix transcriptional regulator [Propionivibrio dicarboxylicus]|uniref:helix-turn-helix transcriptional regulator n=1 Tax=Propionivibrio dicarboxylicus TaxID=83767 RepID=UPI000B887D2F|nr:AlpA family phage regulatory protein [Propionivibrio dicarboxylicus]
MTTTKRKPAAAKPQSPIDLQTAAPGQLLDRNDLKQITRKSRATIFRWVCQGILPKPRKIGPVSNFWTVDEIRSALAKAIGGGQ